MLPNEQRIIEALQDQPLTARQIMHALHLEDAACNILLSRMVQANWIYTLNDGNDLLWVSSIGQQAYEQHRREERLYKLTVAAYWISLASLIVAVVSLLMAL
ncbi:MAG: hypothetical protein IJC61_02610 [Oscillospiraceae bacterium]|nr:hypothetical protein [Oscillospiraceae bacterium]